MSAKLSNFILQQTAREGRTVLSRWRCQYLLWLSGEPFADEARALRVVRSMENLGWAKPVSGSRDQIYRITAPYAPEATNPFEICLEAYHGCSFAYGTAMEIHQLTDQRATEIHLVVPPGIQGNSLSDLGRLRPDANRSILLQQIPVGTDPDAWEVHEIPRFIRMKSVESREIATHKIKDEAVFDLVELESMGTSVRVTSLERTLVDGLKKPGFCGGLNDVFRGWVEALEDFDINRIIEVTERYGSKILFQRVGFVLETLGRTHNRLGHWKEHHVQRGGSRLLDPSKPFAPEYSEAWAISLNHPIDILREAQK